MGLFRKKPDPISERARALKAEISQLETQISRLNERLSEQPPGPRVRSTAGPASPGKGPVAMTPAPAPVPALPSKPPIEPLDTSRLKPPPEAATTEAHYNEMGVRKFDLAGGW